MIAPGTHEQARIIAEAAGVFFNPECNHSIVRVEGDKLLGGVIYQGFTGASIRMHAVGFVPRWIDKDMLWISFEYPFGQLGVNKILVHVHSTNLKSLAFTTKLGFKEEAQITGVYPDADLVIMSMCREDCRWLKRGHRRGTVHEGRSAEGSGHERGHQRCAKHFDHRSPAWPRAAQLG
jgi:hypothetical protein